MAPSRARPPLQLAWNPLVFVLGQVVISPVLQIEDYIPNLQERLRKNGYPAFDRLESQTVKFDRQGSVDVRRETRWVFWNKNKTQSVVISSGFLVLEVSDYQRFDDFMAEFQAVMEIFHAVVDVSLYQRLGFRRINLLEDTPTLPLDSIVREGLRGLEGGVFVDRHDQRLEHWGDTEVGRLMVRLLRPAPESVVPSDLDTTGLTIRQPSAEGRQVATLDIDHFMIEADDFVPDAIVDGFWLLHDGSDLAFRESVTADALQVWAKGDPNEL